MINIESKIISYREDTNDYRLCLTREEIDEIKNAWNDGYYQGATQMEEAKQIIIDSLLKLVERQRAEVIEEVALKIQKIKDAHNENPRLYPINYGTLCGICNDLWRQLKE